MITVEEKLDVFTKLVLEKVQREYEEKKKEIDEKNNEIIQGHKSEISERAHKLIINITGRGEIQKNRLISRAKVEGKRIVLSKKEELLEKLIGNIEGKAVQFTYEDDYKGYIVNSLCEALENLKNKESIILFLTDKDRDRYRELIINTVRENGFDSENTQIQRLEPGLIGGVIAIDREKTVKVDCTIKTRIEDNRNMIGRVLYDALDRK
jgi:vacuolar-type H+-ATPase subunit E/Vma4